MSQKTKTFISLLALSVIAFTHYSSFYKNGFNLADEGSVALISEKLLNGEKPFIDIDTVYGVLWYLPIVFLFKVFGVKFYLIKIYFLVLAFIASLFARGLLLRLTGNHLVAFSAALLVLLFPGTLYKTYIPLLVLSGAYVLFLYDVRTLKPTTHPRLAVFYNGLYFSCAFLIRADIATVYLVLFVLYHALSVLQAFLRDGDPKKFLIVPKRFLGIVFVVFITSLPFAMHAKVSGYLSGFLHQYSFFAEQLVSKIQQRHLDSQAAIAPSAGTLLPRQDVYPFFGFATYFPILIFVFIWLYLIRDFFARRLNTTNLAEFICEKTHLIILSMGAFSAFPQFFLWRPDIDHLSEFTPGFVVLLAYFIFIFKQRTITAENVSIMYRPVFSLFLASIFLFATIYVGIYSERFGFGKNRSYRLQMEKGIDVYTTQYEYEGIRQLASVITKASKPKEFVLCFPYCPGVNFMTNRPTFQKFLYVDDVFLITRPEWLEDTRRDISEKRPRVIVINDWAVNGTEISRFRNWAKPLYEYIEKTYRLKNSVMGYKIFVLKE